MRVQESENAGLKVNILKTKIMASGPITSCQIEGGKWKQWQIFFSWVPKSLWTVTAAMKLKTFVPWLESFDKPRQCIKKHFANKDAYSQSYGFSSSHVQMWELDHKESRASKNSCFWTVVLEKTLERPLDWKEIKPVNLKGNQYWIFTGKTDAEAEAPILWPPDTKKLTHWKRPWCWEGLRAGGEGDDRGWDGWMASLTRCMWV